jgi:transcriptional regulator with XRE-family HTH domain
MDTRARVARNIRRLRVGAGVTQEMLAVDAELETSHVSRMERGLANPTLAVLERIVRALHVDISELFVKGLAGKAALPNLKRGRKRK